jgi:hypothetical protein
MPRESASAKSVNVVAIRQPRLRVPEGLPPAIRDAFAAIVGDHPADAFRPGDGPLVLRLSEVRAMLANPKVALPDYLQLVRAELALCRSLRICPSARMHARTAGRMGGPRPSIYESMAEDE